MLRFRIYPVTLPLAVLFCAAAWGQSRTSTPKLSQSWKLVSVKITGNTAYTPAEVIGASGLQEGQEVNEEDFKRATEKLGETGLFTSVMYAFQYSAAGAKLDLQIVDGDQLVPAVYDNLVWFTADELREKIRARLPLFRGKLPLAGNMADQVSDALQALVIERGVRGQVEYLREGPANGPIQAVIFTVHAHDILIRKTDFSGAPPAELPPLQSAAKSLEKLEYTTSGISARVKYDFMPVFLWAGYLKASFGEPQTRIVEEGPQQTTVDLTIPVTPGLQYKLQKFGWTGNTVFPAAQLQKLVQQQVGLPANDVQMMTDLKEVTKLYGTKGYMGMKVESIPTFDDEHSAVDYEFSVKEGEVYHMGELELRGLDSRTTSRIELKWTLHEGDVYNAGFIDQFLEATREDLPKQASWKVQVHEAPDDKTKTVDVTLRYESNMTR